MDKLVVKYDAEALAVKSICASDILQNVISLAKDLQTLNCRLSRYISQFQLLLTWRRGNAALKMAGSAAKTVASLMVLAAPLHPKLRIALNVGQRLWKLGASLKILTIFAKIVKNLWQNGCRKCLLEFARTAASLSKNLGVFSEVIKDLQKTAQRMNFERIPGAPRQFFTVIKSFVPRAQQVYVAHVSSMIFGGERYSPLFDFVSLISDPASRSLPIQLIRELESFNFTEFTQDTDSKALLVVSSLLHISREVLDFLDGFQQFTDQDCNFLHDCLVKLTQESVTILKVASFLDSLNKENVKKTKDNLGQRKTSVCNADTSKSNEPGTIDTETVASTDEPMDMVNVASIAATIDAGTVVTMTQFNSVEVEPSLQQMSFDSDAMRETLNSTLSHQSSSDNTDNSTDSLKINEPIRTVNDGDGAKRLFLAQAVLSLSDLMKKGGSALLSVPRTMKSKEANSRSDLEFQEEQTLTRI